MKYVSTFFCVKVIFFTYLICNEQALAQEAVNQTNPISEYEDCTDNSIILKQSKGPLTKKERIALMEKAFFSSLNKFDRCQTSAASSSASTTSDSKTADSANQNEGENGLSGEINTNNTANNPVASNEISGTDEQAASALTEAGGLNIQETTKPKKGRLAQVKGNILANGKNPEDIPPADNDSILEAQIRIAAETETDPVKKARLWNEYRRYKGLEIIKSADDK